MGIGITNPGSKLSVSGNAAIGSNYDDDAAPSNGLIVEGDVGIGITNPSYRLQVEGGSIYFNAGKASLDFTVAGLNDSYLLICDGSQDRVGVGIDSSAPDAKLDQLDQILDFD